MHSGVNASEACHGAVPAVTRELASQPEPPAFRRGEESVYPLRQIGRFGHKWLSGCIPAESKVERPFVPLVITHHGYAEAPE